MEGYHLVASSQLDAIKSYRLDLLKKNYRMSNFFTGRLKINTSVLHRIFNLNREFEIFFALWQITSVLVPFMAG